MKMYYFFTKDNEGNLDYGDQYFVMAKDVEAATKAVLESPDWVCHNYANMKHMGVKEYGEGEVVYTELA